MMTELDLHGKLISEAEAIFMEKLNQARLKKNLIEICFITGIGKIQSRFKVLCAQHQLNHYVPLNNSGCIVVEFE